MALIYYSLIAPFVDRPALSGMRDNMNANYSSLPLLEKMKPFYWVTVYDLKPPSRFQIFAGIGLSLLTLSFQ
jgi:hypothetical protein